jgi:GntR family transcriptional regulator / MocR family aminotransferase
MLLRNTSGSPLYIQISNDIKERIISQEFAEGEILPSVRKLSVDLNVSRKTVSDAYDLLISEGYIESRDRIGYFVCGLYRDTADRSKRNFQDHSLPTTRDNSFLYDFHTGRLDEGSFPAALWMKMEQEALRDSQISMAQYTDPQGEVSLRNALCSYLLKSRGVTCNSDRIIITSGLKESLDLVSDLISDRVNTIAIEDPGYRIPYLVFERKFKIVSVPLDESGMKINRLIKSKAQVVYFTPSHQAPMGMVMDIKRRNEIIEWAKSANAFLIEDDYDAELRYNSLPVPALQGMFPDGNIFYTGSVSKVLSPAIRLGYLIIPESIKEKYKEYARQYTSSVSLLTQAAMTRIIEKGHWDKHILKMRVIYKKKHDLLIQSVQRYMSDQVEITGQGAGLHIILKLRNPYLETDIIQAALDRNIHVRPLSAGYRSSKGFNGFIALGFGSIAADELDDAVACLSRALFSDK